MNKYRSTLLLFLGLACFQVRAQQDWIIQLWDGKSDSDLHSGWSKSPLRSRQDIKTQNIAPHFNIYTLKAGAPLNKKDLLANPAVRFAELNLALETRSTPNDPLINQQWHLDNISASKAWDVTKGGLNFNNDTIVIGVIDHGFLTSHEDLKNRIWQNHAEIPGNGKDDDNNGYVDDVYGLSLKYKNEKHPADNINDGLSNHGTSVAGLIGAESNNSKGVTGMMWNNKLMIATFGTNNIGELIEMFNYMLDQRIRYNRSGGKEGAFVVAINYSGGISFAKAADYPIWCGMYDKMGLEGIVNCGATTNKYADVDEEGDMPSTCPSDFLIAVTNTGKDNRRIYNAGFGLNHIDLGAPGEGIYSTQSANINAYISFSGTSAATPVVSGAVGLLYSYPCREWADYQKANPADAARLVKRALLASVDKNSDLSGKTVSGGRLNIARALDTLNSYFCQTLNSSKLKINLIYPNPTNSILNLKINVNSTNKYFIKIIDGLGKTILNANLWSNQNLITLTIPNLSEGIYYGILYDNFSSCTFKFLYKNL
ncbi:MAG TPA: S8/S53 family peptidase [Saprospiraceae bacterium]|nr:S8/S53 family peptidase [Saprospiraceae bacterium]HNT19571.1 S8/S53 family peptidase [Saprospiraceae bacterium]